MKAKINVEVLCPKCGWVMLRVIEQNKLNKKYPQKHMYMMCNNSECELYEKSFSLPTIEIEEIK